jgi:hypothetical protein
MPKYRIYLTEGRQIDIDAHSHQPVGPSGNNYRIDFLDSNQKVIAAFMTESIQGFVDLEKLIDQRGG